MKGTQICPACGQPTLKVKENALRTQMKNPENLAGEKGKWQACVNENCDTVYYKNTIEIKKDELQNAVFFKTKTDETIICYCYKITRGDIKLAIENGCQSTSEVYKFLKRSKKGSCETNNPLGRSCSNVFKFTFNELLKK